jgi:hypothetical protein
MLNSVIAPWLRFLDIGICFPWNGLKLTIILKDVYLTEYAGRVKIDF